MNETVEKLIAIVKEDSNKALGCTEPVAIAYCANTASSYVDRSKIKKIKAVLSNNIYKNAKSVKIPNTGSYGIEIALAVGSLVEKSDEAFMVFSKVDEDLVREAQELIEKGIVESEYIKESPDIYVNVTIETDRDTVEAILINSHTYIEKVTLNGEVVYQGTYKKEDVKSNFDIKDLSFKKLREIIEETDPDKFKFTLYGIEVNMEAANAGLKGAGSNLGKTLNELKNKGILSNNFISIARIMTAAAADMRMAGENAPIVTSGGSGNQGIGVILPIAIVAEKEKVSDERLAKALFFAHAINRYVKEYAGKLSGMCGCAIGAAIGATAGITWLIGGNDEQIAGACSNIYSNLTGMICDGAKGSCSMKLASSAEESIISAYLAINGVISEENVGILGGSIEETIKNIGKLSREAFGKIDDLILEIIEER
ncbi:MAG: serine dehydratase subunit alpha family protein [Tissierellia bacterium]|nr:serine dehydratase subunit alpha family protein [Tissierellia bacterium]